MVELHRWRLICEIRHFAVTKCASFLSDDMVGSWLKSYSDLGRFKIISSNATATFIYCRRNQIIYTDSTAP